VSSLLQAVDRSTAIGKRDYAVLLLAARYGMRPGDIRQLHLDDIQWRRRQIALQQSKTGRLLLLPLLSEVSDALIDYLRHGRPKTEFRNLFVRHLARHLDRFLVTHLAAEDPIITLEVVRAYVVHGGERADATRGNRLCLVRELCRFLAVEDPRHEIPPPRYLGIHRRPFVQRVLTREEGKRFLVACESFPAARCSPLRGTVHGTALMLLYLAGLRLGEALRLTIADVDVSARLLHVRQTKFPPVDCGGGHGLGLASSLAVAAGGVETVPR
jgi:integrase